MGIFQTSITQIEQAKANWDKLLPSITESFPHNGMTVNRQDVEKLFNETVDSLLFVDLQENPDTATISIYFQSIATQIQQLQSYLSQLPSNPTAYLPAILNGLWALKNSIFWLTPANGLNNLSAQPDEIEAKVRAIEIAHGRISKQIEEIKPFQNEINAIQEFLPQAQILSAETQKFLQEVNNAKISAEGSAVSASAKNQELTERAVELKKLVDTQNNSVLYFEEKRAIVESTLEGASKVALANAFNVLQLSHNSSKNTWKWFFMAGIAIMVLIEIAAFYFDIPVLPKDTWIGWFFLSKLMVTSPAIWFTWFAVLQYSKSMRLEEDYAFKSAAAQSFYGYRREVGADEELLKLLQETAIKNFGANPVQVLGKTDHGTPLHELLDKLLSKGGFDKSTIEKIIDVLASYGSKSPTK